MSSLTGAVRKESAERMKPMPADPRAETKNKTSPRLQKMGQGLGTWDSCLE